MDTSTQLEEFKERMNALEKRLNKAEHERQYMQRQLATATKERNTLKLELEQLKNEHLTSHNYKSK